MSVPAAIKGAPAAPSVQEYVIRVPKNSRKKYNVMRFNATLNVDFAKWSQVKLERENNMKEYKGFDEDMPKFGAGSEFGRDAREEARRKKYGINSRKYKPDDQPWILKSGGKTGKKFKGIREGGISENTAYYVFTHATDGAIEAFPLQEWYNFQPIQRYKTLSAEEAEIEFSNRNKTLNYFNLMMRKRLRNDEDGGEDDLELADAGKKLKGMKRSEKELKISEMDEWMESDDDSDGSETEKKKGSDEEDDGDKKKKKGKIVKKKKKNASDDEAFDDSDDGDVEGRECDYISDSSNSESDGDQHKQIKSVAEEDALRKLLASDEEDEDEAKDKDKQADEEDDANEEGKSKEDAGKEADKKKDKKKKKSKKNSKKKDSKKGNSSSDFSSDSDTDPETTKSKDKDSKDKNSSGKKPGSLQNSRSATPTPGTSGGSGDSLKRKHSDSPDNSASKKIRPENFTPTPAIVSTPMSIPGSSESGITEEAVRRYLIRKPMTATELLQKFKSKKSGLNSEKLVLIMTQILKKINPTKQTIKNKMYLSIKQ